MSVEEQFIRNVDKLVPCPRVALEVLQHAHEPHCDLATLEATIERDPNLTATMLRMANSAYYGHMHQIHSVREIVIRLGVDAIKIIAITGASVACLRSPQIAYNLEPGALWRHSHATAILAAILARHARETEPAAVYTAALLHDIGKVLLNRPLQQEAGRRGPDAAGKPSGVAWERSVLGTDHARVGKALLADWGLPTAIVDPVGSHHDRPGIVTAPLASRIVFAANAVVESIGIHGLTTQIPPPLDEMATAQEDWSFLPGFQEGMEAIIDEFFGEYMKTSSLFAEHGHSAS
ncbi:MAG: HDOD domain-containing protein [Thermodesulfobacteriota bacterium]